MRATLRRALAACALALPLAGCGVTGLLYTEVTLPLDLDARDTATQPRSGDSAWKTFNYVVRVDWSGSAIADAAHRAGLTEIHFADLRVQSVLLGVWSQRTAIVYGR